MADVLLPHKLSELAQIALDDVLAVEQRDDYLVHMGHWHDPGGIDERCAVCAAGAVMVERLGAEKSIDYWPNEFGTENARALYAIDYLRQGHVGSALGVISGKVDWLYERQVAPSHALDRLMPEYASGEHWRAAMRTLIADLQKAGL